MSILLEALRKKYESQISCAKANIHVYAHSPSGIGDHPDLVSAVDEEMTKLSTAQDKLDVLERHYGKERKSTATI